MIQIYYICIIKNVHFSPLLSIPYPKSECRQNKKWTKVDVDPPPPPKIIGKKKILRRLM